MGDEDKEHMDDAKAIHELLTKHTLHTGVFHKCSFAKVETPVWNNDMKYMIQIVILTWLRQLEEHFFWNENKTWAVLRDYLGNENKQAKKSIQKCCLEK
jgi:hypothetical protein